MSSKEEQDSSSSPNYIQVVKTSFIKHFGCEPLLTDDDYIRFIKGFEAICLSVQKDHYFKKPLRIIDSVICYAIHTEDGAIIHVSWIFPDHRNPHIEDSMEICKITIPKTDSKEEILKKFLDGFVPEYRDIMQRSIHHLTAILRDRIEEVLLLKKFWSMQNSPLDSFIWWGRLHSSRYEDQPLSRVVDGYAKELESSFVKISDPLGKIRFRRFIALIVINSIMGIKTILEWQIPKSEESTRTVVFPDGTYFMAPINPENYPNKEYKDSFPPFYEDDPVKLVTELPKRILEFFEEYLNEYTPYPMAKEIFKI